MRDLRSSIPIARGFLIVAMFGVSSVAPVAPVAEEPAYQHGISLLHELKYGADFEHFEYANPDAPKGGTLVLSTNMNISNFSGQPASEVPNAPGLGRTYDSLLVRTGDELSGLYGWLAEGVALAEDKRSLHIRLHPRGRRISWIRCSSATFHGSMEEAQREHARGASSLEGRRG